MPEIEIGRVNSTAPLKVGDEVHIAGHTTDLTLVVDSMQIDNADVEEASPADDVGIKVPDRVRRGDRVYKVTA